MNNLEGMAFVGIVDHLMLVHTAALAIECAAWWSHVEGCFRLLVSSVFCHLFLELIVG